jgi:hypothetical protein
VHQLESTYLSALRKTMMLKLPVKVENILKGSLDSIPSPSPSVKIQILGGKFCLRCKGKTSNTGYLLKSFLLYQSS